MKLSQYKFNLPPELIAKYPSANRDESRLMIIHRDTGEMSTKFLRILSIVLVRRCYGIQQYKVFPARLYGNKGKNRC